MKLFLQRRSYEYVFDFFGDIPYIIRYERLIAMISLKRFLGISAMVATLLLPGAFLSPAQTKVKIKETGV